MTAHVAVQSYGPTCRVICPEHALNDSYARWKPAAAAAHQHNTEEH